VAKKRSGEETKISNAGQKLGCNLSPDASALLGALEYTIDGGSGPIVTRGLVALVETLPRSQIDGITAMMRLRGASLSRLKRSIQAVEVVADGGAGEGGEVRN
jgi:hypothetical protein